MSLSPEPAGPTPLEHALAIAATFPSYELTPPVVDERLTNDTGAWIARMWAMPKCSACGRPLTCRQPGVHFVCAEAEAS